jgi:transposase
MTDVRQREQPRGRTAITPLSRGPVWRGTSVPIRRRRTTLGALLDKLLKKNLRQIVADETGKAICDLCDDVRTIDQIVAALREQFHGDASEIQADVMHAIRILADAGLLTSSDTSADAATRSIDLRDVSILVINGEDQPDRRETVARDDEACQRLMTVPGIGPIIASAMVATIGDGSAFRRGRDFGAWLGLVPR